MSTYDGAYSSNRTVREGWNSICTCDEDEVNEWCKVHGKEMEYEKHKKRMAIVRTSPLSLDDWLKSL